MNSSNGESWKHFTSAAKISILELLYRDDDLAGQIQIDAQNPNLLSIINIMLN